MYAEWSAMPDCSTKTERLGEYEAHQIALSAKPQNPVSDLYTHDLLDLIHIRAGQGDLAQVKRTRYRGYALWLAVLQQSESSLHCPVFAESRP